MTAPQPDPLPSRTAKSSLAGLAAASCLVTLAAGASAQQAGFDPPEAADLDPDPQVVEVDLVAAPTTWQLVPGVDTVVWAYNGSIPGPTIRADVGQTVRVNFTNALPEETTVHWHGIEVPSEVDGSHISQLPIPPGASHTYEFEVLHDGFFWYHPHVRPFDQVEKGLYGGVVLTDRALEHRLGLDQVEEHLIFFDDVLLDAAMQLVPAFSFADPLQNALYHVNGREGNHLLVNGRESSGVTLRVPDGEPQRWRVINVANTSFCRLDLNDPAQGFGTPIWELGSDGGFLERPFQRTTVTSPFDPGTPAVAAGAPSAGLVGGASAAAAGPGSKHAAQAQIPHMDQGVLLFPGERMDVVFTPRKRDRQRFTVFQHDWFRGRHSAAFGPGGQIVLGDDPGDGLAPKRAYFDVLVDGRAEPGATAWAPPARLRAMPPMPGPVVGQLPVTFGHGLPDPDSGAIVLFAQAMMVNGVMTPLPAPKIDSFNAHDVEVGDTWQWKITNLSHGDHDFHTHGFFFELEQFEWQDDLDPTLNQTFVPTTRRIKDTIRVPARLGQLGTSRTITTLRVHFDDTGREGRTAAQGMLPTFAPDGSWTPGGWLFHCHLLEHSGKGMLSVLELHEPGEDFRLLGKALAGTLGRPSLTGAGDPALPATASFELVDALPGAQAFLITGDEPVRTPFAGGELVPGTAGAPNGGSVIAALLGAQRQRVDAAGRATWTLGSWGTLASGDSLYVQVAVRDPGGAEGWALSNALQVTRP